MSKRDKRDRKLPTREQMAEAMKRRVQAGELHPADAADADEAMRIGETYFKTRDLPRIDDADPQRRRDAWQINRWKEGMRESDALLVRYATGWPDEDDPDPRRRHDAGELRKLLGAYRHMAKELGHADEARVKAVLGQYLCSRDQAELWVARHGPNAIPPFIPLSWVTGPDVEPKRFIETYMAQIMDSWLSYADLMASEPEVVSVFVNMGQGPLKIVPSSMADAMAWLDGTGLEQHIQQGLSEHPDRFAVPCMVHRTDGTSVASFAFILNPTGHSR
jgi:hypothetical protein